MRCSVGKFRGRICIFSWNGGRELGSFFRRGWWYIRGGDDIQEVGILDKEIRINKSIKVENFQYFWFNNRIKVKFNCREVILIIKCFEYKVQILLYI